ncbi:MAG: NAD(P)-dependent oxidoreductase [Spirochaetaceae bacterium]|jgi:UDP-glucose 4-epimerase|nr:NAD(P)-dependent oxidoreductase [Spirochaetaceae bacterium]
MAVFITGAGGFLGQALIHALLKDGKKVLAFDYNAPPQAVLDNWKGKVDFRQGDIRDGKLIDALIAESGTTDPIVHLAGVLTAACDRDPPSAITINQGGTYNVLEGALRHGKRQVIFASTISVYGRGLPQPIVETVVTRPDGWYGATKIMAEVTGLMYADRHGLDFRAVRFAAVTGAGRVAVGSASLFTSLIPEKAARGEPYAIEVTPDTSYPVVYIKDAVDALIKLMNAPHAPSRIYNIASGNIVVNKMVDYIKKVIPDAKFTYEPVADIMAVVAGYKEWTINCGCAKKELGWTPSYGVEKMVDDIIAAVRAKK